MNERRFEKWYASDEKWILLKTTFINEHNAAVDEIARLTMENDKLNDGFDVANVEFAKLKAENEQLRASLADAEQMLAIFNTPADGHPAAPVQEHSWDTEHYRAQLPRANMGPLLGELHPAVPGGINDIIDAEIPPVGFPDIPVAEDAAPEPEKCQHFWIRNDDEYFCNKCGARKSAKNLYKQDLDDPIINTPERMEYLDKLAKPPAPNAPVYPRRDDQGDILWPVPGSCYGHYPAPDQTICDDDCGECDECQIDTNPDGGD